MSKKVVVIGGGVTGLATAFRVTRAGQGHEVTVLEERERLGGNIITERRDGCVIDGGPDSFVVARPQASQLCKDAGLGGDLIGTREQNRKVYIAHHGELHLLPEGLVLGIPTRFLPFAKTPLFTWTGKARMGLDLFIPKRPKGGDESIGSFFKRRLGDEMLRRMADPLLGGIYAGNVDELSLKSTFPQLLELEDKYGSLIKGALAQRRAAPARDPKAPPPSVFSSLRGGMGSLIDALAKGVEERGGKIRRGAKADAILRIGDRFAVSVGGDTLEADSVVMATPAYVAADTVSGLDADMADLLRKTPYLSTGTVFVAYSRKDVPHALDASGVILPPAEGRSILAATFVSSKWESRSPDDIALMRVFVGGHRDPQGLTKSDAQLVEIARRELASLVGVRAEPLFSRVFRYERANAQPIVGHAARLAELRARAKTYPGLYFAGAAFEGVGIPDCVRQAEETAAAILRG